MGYYQTVFNFGEKNFVHECKKSKVSGCIIVDLPWPENKNFSKLCKKNNITFVQLISPTTTLKRMREIIKNSDELNYFISMLSTTGGKLKGSANRILKQYKKVKRINPSKKLIIGFGITRKNIKSLKNSDGLVVGSELCKGISDALKKRQNPIKKLNKMVKELKTQIS